MSAIVYERHCSIVIQLYCVQYAASTRFVVLALADALLFDMSFLCFILVRPKNAFIVPQAMQDLKLSRCQTQRVSRDSKCRRGDGLNVVFMIVNNSSRKTEVLIYALSLCVSVLKLLFCILKFSFSLGNLFFLHAC